MAKTATKPVLIAHGGAGGRAPIADRPDRRRGLLAAVQRGAMILRDGGTALDAVTATVAQLEDDSLFNAGYGSTLTLEGKVEMDAAVMTAERVEQAFQPRLRATTSRRNRWRSEMQLGRAELRTEVRAGGVVLVSRVRNPILLARAVMEHTPHVLIGGRAAERLARQAGVRLCRPEQLITDRARNRWLALWSSALSPPQSATARWAPPRWTTGVIWRQPLRLGAFQANCRDG